MPSHKFKVGDTVTINPAIGRFVPGGVFEVIKQLPGGNDLNIASRAPTNRMSVSRGKAILSRFRGVSGMR